jgi:endonuclease/exonuclease/phosphatase family metal-dependent hydrolase
MKLISLNLWGGMVNGPLVEFLKLQGQTADIFCFQEVFSALPGAPEESSGARMFLFNELENLLPEFAGFFDGRSLGYNFKATVSFPVSHGLAVFVRKNLPVISYRSEILEQTQSITDPLEGWTKCQVLTVAAQNGDFSVINFHGVGRPGNKLDTPQRLEHMQRLALIWESLGDYPKILCGDFNLYPETQSIKIIEGLGENLIRKYNIKNTRNEISWKKYPNEPQHFADYAFVSAEVNVKNFQVPYNEVSDHLPIILEFEI